MVTIAVLLLIFEHYFSVVLPVNSGKMKDRNVPWKEEFKDWGFSVCVFWFGVFGVFFCKNCG